MSSGTPLPKDRKQPEQHSQESVNLSDDASNSKTLNDAIATLVEEIRKGLLVHHQQSHEELKSAAVAAVTEELSEGISAMTEKLRQVRLAEQQQSQRAETRSPANLQELDRCFPQSRLLEWLMDFATKTDRLCPPTKGALKQYWGAYVKQDRYYKVPDYFKELVDAFVQEVCPTLTITSYSN